MMIVVLEGLTKAGKTTACEIVTSTLQKKGQGAVNLNTVLDSDPTAITVRSITHPSKMDLSPPEELLLYSVRLSRKAYHIHRLTSLEPSIVVIVDRFTISLYTFFEIVRKMHYEIIDNVISISKANIVPDLTVLLDIPLSELLIRENKKKRSRKHKELEFYFNEYRDAFLSRVNNCEGNYYIIDSVENGAQEVANIIVNQIQLLM